MNKRNELHVLISQSEIYDYDLVISLRRFCGITSEYDFVISQIRSCNVTYIDM